MPSNQRLRSAAAAPRLARVNDNEPTARRQAGNRWERIDHYLVSLSRSRRLQRQRRPKPRSEPENPRALLSTVPFVALILGLAVVAFAVIVAAWPGRERKRAPVQPQERELGRAPPGWIDRSGR